LQKYCSSLSSVLKILYKEGYIQSYKLIKTFLNTKIKVILRSLYNKSVINSISIISKPSHKIFIRYNDLIRLSNKGSTLILSTKLGLLTHNDCIKKTIGGKALFSLS